MTDWLRREKVRIQIAVITTAVSAVTVAVCCVIALYIVAKPTITPEEHRYGLAPNHAILAAPLVSASPAFQIVDDQGRPVVQDNIRANIRPWEMVRKLDSPGKPVGTDWKNIPQEIGDCVSWGYCNAANYTLGIAAGRNGGIRGPPRLYPPWIYGVSRVDIGRGQLRGQDGSVGAWAATGGETKGHLTWDDAGAPPYTGQVARQWGNSGPPKSLYSVAAERLATKAIAAKTADDIMDGLANGYASTIASSRFGCRTWRVRDGRRVANNDDRWGHQQCVIGYDGSSPSGERYYYVLNSWGEDWGPEPMQSEPRGGYWITHSQLESICREGDSWVITGVNGLVEQQLNWSIIKTTPRKAKEDHEERITNLPREWTTFPLPADAGLHNPFRAPGVRIRAAGGRPAEARLVNDWTIRGTNPVRARESDRAGY